MARVALGGAMVGSVVEGHISGDFHPAPWVLGLVVFPAVIVAGHSWAARRAPARLSATGLVAHCAPLVTFLALYPFEPTSDAALLFFGGSMLLAAAKSVGGCEVLALSNWVLRRDDEVGCVVFGPIDRVERRRRPEPAGAPVAPDVGARR
ncbi:MAG: hypothetical protein ACRD12_14290 [Acidimicrobiales bacterium]